MATTDVDARFTELRERIDEIRKVLYRLHDMLGAHVHDNRDGKDTVIVPVSTLEVF